MQDYGSITQAISIHVPREGDDLAALMGGKENEYFNPRPP